MIYYVDKFYDVICFYVFHIYIFVQPEHIQ